MIVIVIIFYIKEKLMIAKQIVTIKSLTTDINMIQIYLLNSLIVEL